MNILLQISDSLQQGSYTKVKGLIKDALDKGITAEMILCEGLLKGISAVGEKLNNNEFKVMIGGASVTQNFCDLIGADYYAPNAATASEIALKICMR